MVVSLGPILGNAHPRRFARHAVVYEDIQSPVGVTGDEIRSIGLEGDVAAVGTDRGIACRVAGRSSGTLDRQSTTGVFGGALHDAGYIGWAVCDALRLWAGDRAVVPAAALSPGTDRRSARSARTPLPVHPPNDVSGNPRS